MNFTRKNVVGKNMIFSIQNSNAKRQPMNMTNPIHSASARLQFQYSKPNIRQNNHLMSTNMQYSVVKPKGQRLWSPVVHQKLKTRMYCNTVYECDPDDGLCFASRKGTELAETCAANCEITNFYTCDASNYTCTLDPLAPPDVSGFKSTCKTNCFKHYDCCGNTGTCYVSGLSGQYTDKTVCDTSCANFKCNPLTGDCSAGGGTQTKTECEASGNAGGRCANFDCNAATGECSAGRGTQTKAACEVSGNAGGLCANFSCDTSTGECSAGVGTLTKAACEVSGNAGGLCANFSCDRTTGVCMNGSGTQTSANCSNICVASCDASWSPGVCIAPSGPFGTNISASNEDITPSDCSTLCKNEDGPGCCTWTVGGGGPLESLHACWWIKLSDDPSIYPAGGPEVLAKLCEIPE
jgi:hypothetical protein